jgi:hypothetical protein
MKLSSKIALGLISLFFLAACTSGQIKARKAQRDQEAQSSKLYCEFINGEQYPDIDVEVNLQMSKHCDDEKSMTMTSYRSPSEAVGIVYCCGMKEKEVPKDEHAHAKLKEPVKEEHMHGKAKEPAVHSKTEPVKDTATKEAPAEKH